MNDTEQIWQSTNTILKEHDVKPLTQDAFAKAFEIPIENFYKKYLPAVDMATIDQKFYEDYPKIIEQSKLYSGAEQLLQFLQLENYQLLVLSTINSDLIEQKIAKLKLPISKVYGSSADKKVDLNTIIEQHHLNREFVFFVGDSVHDVEAGICNNVKTVGCLYGQTAELRSQTDNKADFYIDSIAQLRQHIKQFEYQQTMQMPIATVGGIVIAKDTNRFALVQTNKWSGKWGVAGGKIQYGETMQQAFKREIYEEIGLTVADFKIVLIQDSIDSQEFHHNRHFILINFCGFITSETELKVNSEIINQGWFDYASAKQLPLNQPTVKLLDYCFSKKIIMAMDN